MPARFAHPRPASQPTVLDPSAVFVAKSLFAPLLVVASLELCLLAAGESVGGPSFLLAVLAFLTAAGVIEPTGIDAAPLTLRGLVDVLLRWLLLIAFLWAVIALSGLETHFAPRPLLAWAVCTPFALWLGQWCVGRVIGKAAARSGPPRTAVIVGLSEVGLKLERALNTSLLLHTKVLGFFEDRSISHDVQRLPAAGQKRIIGPTAALPEYVRCNKIQQVYITLPMTREPRVMALVESLRDSTASVYFVPDLFAFSSIQARFDVIEDVAVIAVCETPFIGASSLAKRLCDLVLSGLALVLLAPLFALVALAIRLGSPGPALFRQRRYGLDGAEIRMYKFRSMSVIEDGDGSYRQTTRDDARLTRLGALLRRTSIDELPQLINVFLGQMSLVGPRPHVVAVNEQYRKLIPGYMVRHKVKPGITGWAQVNGARGGDDLESMRRRIQYDLEYLRHWSLALDFSILLRTVFVVLRDRHAY